MTKMITKEYFLMIGMLGTMMAAGLTACSGDDDTATNGSTPQTADDGGLCRPAAHQRAAHLPLHRQRRQRQLLHWHGQGHAH